MKKLKYKDVTFDCFCLVDNEKDIYTEGNDANENTNLKDYDEIIGTYICPHCIKKYGLYKETETTEVEINEHCQLEDSDLLGSVCCIDGCYNDNTYDIWLDTKQCSLI